MSRFSKGTTDHDGDGRMGGSRPGATHMAKGKTTRSPAAREQKAAVRAQAAPSLPARKDAQADQFDAADDKAAEAVRDATLSRAVRGY
jgi:hypothetical protein